MFFIETPSGLIFVSRPIATICDREVQATRRVLPMLLLRSLGFPSMLSNSDEIIEKECVIMIMGKTNESSNRIDYNVVKVHPRKVAVLSPTIKALRMQ